MHLRWLVQPPSALTMAMAVLRFNCSVSYGGLQFATSQEGIFFSENNLAFWSNVFTDKSLSLINIPIRILNQLFGRNTSLVSSHTEHS